MFVLAANAATQSKGQKAEAEAELRLRLINNKQYLKHLTSSIFIAIHAGNPANL
jgi:hypothetical protein